MKHFLIYYQNSSTIMKFSFAIILLTGINCCLLGQTPNADLFICKVTLTEQYLQAGLAEKELAVVKQHTEYLHELGNNGKLVFAGRTKLDPTDKRNYAIILLKGSSLEEVQKIRDKDPCFKNSIQTWEIFPFSLGIRFLENLN